VEEWNSPTIEEKLALMQMLSSRGISLKFRLEFTVSRKSQKSFIAFPIASTVRLNGKILLGLKHSGFGLIGVQASFSKSIPKWIKALRREQSVFSTPDKGHPSSRQASHEFGRGLRMPAL
jgi:hypothetical protein